MKQHPLCTDCEQSSTPMDMPIPDGLKREWAALETRRRFLGCCAGRDERAQGHPQNQYGSYVKKV